MAELALQIIVLLLAGASLAALAWVFSRIRSGRAILPHESRRPVPWGMGEVLIIVALAILTPLVGILLSGVEIDRQRGLAGLAESELIFVLALTGFARLFAFAFGTLLLAFGSRASEFDLGLDRLRENLDRDFRLGVVGLCVGLIPVFTLQILLHHYFENGHQIVEAVQQQPLSLGLVLAATFSVVIAAPLIEEFTFRLVLQGWLEKIDRWLAPTPAERREASRAGSHLRGETILPADVAAAEPATESPESEPFSASNTQGVTRGIMPIAVSSLLFSALHIGQGSTPISLIPLAVILGYLYYRTHRLVPCIILHALFNLLNMIFLWLAIEAGQKLN